MVEFYFSRFELYRVWVKKGHNGHKVFACIMAFGFSFAFFSTYIPEKILETISIVGVIATIILFPFIVVTVISNRRQ